MTHWRIMVVNPNSSTEMTDSAVAGVAAPAGVTVIGRTSTAGPAMVESNADEAVGALAVLREIDRAETGSASPDGYVIACFGDTGLAAAKERAAGPVVGMTEAALLTAALIAHRFTVITMPRRTLAMSDRCVRELGLEHRCQVRAIDEPVGAVTGGSLHLLDEFRSQAALAVRNDAAEAIVLGCAGLADLVEPLQAAIGIPVIEGVRSAVGLVHHLLLQGLSTSRANTYAASGAAGGEHR